MISDGEGGGALSARKHSEARITEALKQVEAGRLANLVNRTHRTERDVCASPRRNRSKERDCRALAF